MPMVATMKPYTLFVSEDDMPPNPRTDYNNFGKMLCWHSRYSLGDKHSFDEPREFLEKELFDIYSSYPSSEYGKPVYDFIKSGKAETARLEYDKSAREWVLYEKWFVGSGWSKSSSYAAALKGKDIPDWFLNDCLAALEQKELLQLLEKSGSFAVLPLYLYDHSGITMNTDGFSCPWDSGQVGWIYADEKSIKDRFGKVTPETIEKAKGVLKCEVEDYDFYLTGQCYGFQLFEGEVETDSCWGFLGEIRDLQNDLKDYMPEGFEALADNLQYTDDNDLNIYDYIKETEDELDAEIL